MRGKIFRDDRTDEQQHTHTALVVGRDTFMSGWGGAPRRSYAAWACLPSDVDKVLAWVCSRSDMRNVRIVMGNTYGWVPRGFDSDKGDHFHVYVVDYPEHPALAD